MCQVCTLHFPRELIDSRAKPHEGGATNLPTTQLTELYSLQCMGNPRTPKSYSPRGFKSQNPPVCCITVLDT